MNSLIVLIIIVLGCTGAVVLAGLTPRLPLWSRSRLHTRQKVVALTFDDGPSIYTPLVLKILETANIRATFFMVGENVRRYPSIARAIVLAGHTIGNHSDDHNLSKQILYPAGQLLANINRANRAILDATGLLPRFYRPPHGYRTVWGAHCLYQAGYRIINWDTMTFDYLDRTSAHWIERRIVRKTKPGSIIVLHDGLETKQNFPRENMLTALPGIISTLKASGYNFVGIEELFNESPYAAAEASHLPHIRLRRQKTRS